LLITCAGLLRNEHTSYLVIQKRKTDRGVELTCRNLSNLTSRTVTVQMFNGTCIYFCCRCLYDINTAVSENMLTLVGASWLTAETDDYVIYRNANGNATAEAELCDGRPSYSNPCSTSGTPIITISSVVIVTLLFLISFAWEVWTIQTRKTFQN